MPAPPQSAVLLRPLAHSSPPPPRASVIPHISHGPPRAGIFPITSHMKRNIWPSLTEHCIPWHYLCVSNHPEPYPQWFILLSSPPVQFSASLAPTPGSDSGGGCRPTEQQPATEASSRGDWTAPGAWEEGLLYSWWTFRNRAGDRMQEQV